MSFVTLPFWVFTIAIFFAYLLLPARFRWVLLLGASYFFYAYWDWRYLPLLWTSTVIDYVCVHKMAQKEDKASRKPWLYLSLLVNLGFLFFFKYWNFVGSNIGDLINQNIELHHFLLPLGISFYTFQTLSYSLDAYAGRIKPERHFGHFCLYVSFFPQLVAGPIERSQSLLPQLTKLRLATIDEFRHGVCLIMWGLVLKLVIADNLSPTINAILLSENSHSGVYYWIAGGLVSFKIYCDFMAYSEIARGLALLFGVKLTINFRRPFLATNIHDYWQRWHISLTRWIGVYIQLPLLKHFPGKWSRYIVTIATMTIIGLWHGASWNFIAFGLYHGLLLAFWNPVANFISRFFPDGFNRWHWFSRLVLAIVYMTGANLFYLSDPARLATVFNGMLSVQPISPVTVLSDIPFRLDLAKAMFGLALLTTHSFLSEYKKYDYVTIVTNSNTALRWASLSTLLLIIILLGNFDVEEFIYFVF